MQSANWKELPRDNVNPRWAHPYLVSINPRGHIALTRRTWENLGEPEAFVIRFDQANGRLGLKPASRETQNAYPACDRSRSGGCGKFLRAYRLISDFGVNIPETLRFVRPEPDHEGTLILDLRTAEVSPHGRGRKGEGKKASS